MSAFEITKYGIIHYYGALTIFYIFCNAYIIYRIGRYNIHGKKILELGDSFYFEDLGLRNHLVGVNRRFDIEKVMENAVYRHLLRLAILSI